MISSTYIPSVDVCSSSGFWVGRTSLQSWKRLLNAVVLSGQEKAQGGEKDEEEANLKENVRENLVNLSCKKESVVSLLTDSEGEACQQEACQQESEACQQESEACQQESEACQQEACQEGACHLEDHQEVEKGAEDGSTDDLYSSATDKRRKPVVEGNKAMKEDAGAFNEDVLCAHGVCICSLHEGCISKVLIYAQRKPPNNRQIRLFLS